MATFKEAPIGKKFTRLTITGEGERDPCGMRKWTWLCDCGRIGSAQACAIKSGATKSCGCFKASIHQKNPDARTRDPVYLVWLSMKSRCSCPSSSSFKHYGQRGISFCEEWKYFEVFKKDMGPKPPGHTLERRNVNEGYNSSNCYWATHKTQMNNTRKNVFIDVNGETLTIAQASEKFSVPYMRLYQRIRKGWPVEKAIRLKYHQRHMVHK